MAKGKAFVLKYMLPGEILAGYHVDSVCTVGGRPDAKVYTTSTPADQVAIVQRNFRDVWKMEQEYRNHSCFRGCSVDQISVVAEPV